MAQGDNKKETPLVITPAGPLPKDRVHRVGPNEEVRRQPDGTYVIVPKKDQDNKEN